MVQDKIRDMKLQYENEMLVQNLPIEFLYMMTYLKTLQYSSCPDYHYLDQLLSSLLIKSGGMNILSKGLVAYFQIGTPETPFDWETEESAADAIKLDTSVSHQYQLILINLVQCGFEISNFKGGEGL